MAQKVLQSGTKGYGNHPQLVRFKNTDNPLGAIGSYLEEIYKESLKRGYCFNKSKIVINRFTPKIEVKRGQIKYEFEHLKNKIKKRDIKSYKKIEAIEHPEINPIFKGIEGGIENWEIIDNK